MSVILSYLIKGSNQDVLDLRTPGREYELVGQSVVVTGSTASNIVYSAPGVELDARGLGGGEDVIVFTHAWSDYAKDTSSVPGGIVFTYVDSSAGLTERVIVGNGVATLTRDLLVFADGAALTQNVNTAVRANPNVAISTVTGYNASLTNESIVVPTDSGSITNVRASSTGPGAVFAMSTPGQETQFTGTGGVDKVYIKAGSVVDARGLLGGEDIIYFTGNWSDYAKSTTAVSGAIQFTRSIGGRTEIVTVGNGVSTQSRDKLVFADGAVLTQNINNALRTDANVAISAITGYESATTTPFLSDVSSVTFSGGQSSGLANGTANAGDIVVFDVAMKSAVTVDTTGGTPRLAINVGGQTKFADYDAASSTGTTLRFKYVIAAGDTDADGISVDAGNLVLGGGTLQDAAGNDALLSHAGIAADTNYKVDAVAPILSSLAIAGQTGAQNNLLNTGDTVTLEATFSESVIVTGTPSIAIRVGAATRNAVYVGGSGTNKLQFRYTIAAGDGDASGVSLDGNALELNGGSIIDTAGNAAQLSHDALEDDATYSVDTTSPAIGSVVVSSASGRLNGLLNAGDALTLTVSFSEKVFVDVTSGAPALKILIGGQQREAVYAAGSGSDVLTFHYTVQNGDNDATGIAIPADAIVLHGATIVDVAGNAAPLTHPEVAANPDYRVDTAEATISGLAFAGQSGAHEGLLKAGGSVTLEVSFNEIVTVDTGAGTPTLAVNVGGQVREAVYVSGSGTTKLNFRYTVAAGDNNGDGLSDLLVGARYNDFSASTAGRAYVVFGKTGNTTVQLTDIARNSGGFAISGERAGDQFSFDVSNAGDVNGDGLGDLLVGAWNNATTAANAGRAYIFFGRTDGAMGGTSVDLLGDASANALGDGGTAMTIVAGAGDDVVTLSAAGSIAYGGAGNDTIHINGAMIAALSAKYGAGGNLGQLATIGGGSGVDTLTLDGAGLTLDLTQVSNASASLPNGSSRITSVERVDLTGSGNNTVKLSINDVLDMSEANLFAANGRHQLMVSGDAGDAVQLAGLSSWTKSGTVDYAGGTYDAWNHNNALGTVYVLQSLTVLPV